MGNKIPPWLKKKEPEEFSCDIFPRCFFQCDTWDDSKVISEGKEKSSKSNPDLKREKDYPSKKYPSAEIYSDDDYLGNDYI